MEKGRIVIAGGAGFMGEALAAYLAKKYQVIILSRTVHKNADNITFVQWDGINLNEKWTKYIDGSVAVINLSGKSVNCRYNEKNKAEIFASRLNSTKAIRMAIEQCTNPPECWINAASATIYRHAEDRPMTESTGELGKGFSVEVCKAWEKTFYEVCPKNVRQIAIRTAIVIADHGSVMNYFSGLAKMFLAGKMGNGKQKFSWIHIDDFCRAVDWFLDNKNCKGTYNLASPNPVTNAQFMAWVRKKNNRKFGLPLPKLLLEMGAFLLGTETELILKSRWVLPERLLAEGFVFGVDKLS